MKSAPDRQPYSDGSKHLGNTGHTAAHPGFANVQNSMAAKQGISKAAAGAELSAATRNASPKAKQSNPNLKNVK